MRQAALRRQQAFQRAAQRCAASLAQRRQRQRAGAAFIGAAGGGVDKVAVGNHHGQRVALAQAGQGFVQRLRVGQMVLQAQIRHGFRLLC